MRTADTGAVMHHLMGQHSPVRAKTHHCLSSDLGACTQSCTRNVFQLKEDGWEFLFSPQLSPNRKILITCFQGWNLKALKGNPKNRFIFFFSLLVKSSFQKCVRIRHFPWKFSLRRESQEHFWSFKQNIFLPALTTALLRIPPRVSVTFILCMQDRFYSNTGWIGPQLKKGYWKFINPKFPFFFFFPSSPTGIGKWQLPVGVCKNRPICLLCILLMQMHWQ